MRVIHTWDDLQETRRETVIPEAILHYRYLEKFFVELFESFGAEDSLRHFSLESYGSMVQWKKLKSIEA